MPQPQGPGLCPKRNLKGKMKHEEEIGKGKKKGSYGFVVTVGILMPFFWYTLCKTGVVAEVVWPLYWIGAWRGRILKSL